MTSDERGGWGYWTSDETIEHHVLEEKTRLDTLEEQAVRVQRRIEELERRRSDMEQQRDEARQTLEKALKELQQVKGELDKMCVEVKGCHSREFDRLQETKVLKDSNIFLKAEVERLDKVALALENELSAAELALETKEQGEESSKQLHRELEAALQDLHSKEWRIDDLMQQVNDLKDCLLKYQGDIMDLERRNENLVQALEESEASYHSVMQSSMASLQMMDTRLSELKRVVSKQGSNASLENHEIVRHDVRNGDKSTDNVGIYSSTPDTPESRLAAFSKHSQVDRVSRESSALFNFEARLCEMEKQYAGTQTLCEELKRENAALKVREAEIKAENRLTIEKTLEKIDQETEEKLQQMLKKQQVELETCHREEVEHLLREKRCLETTLQDTVEKASNKENKTNAALEAANAEVERKQTENKRLLKEKNALCQVVEELKQALSLAEDRLVKHVDIVSNKENPVLHQNSMSSPQKALVSSPGAGRGTPLRSLAVNVFHD